jgi:hypothetical protein
VTRSCGCIRSSAADDDDDAMAAAPVVTPAAAGQAEGPPPVASMVLQRYLYKALAPCLGVFVAEHPSVLSGGGGVSKRNNTWASL